MTFKKTPGNKPIHKVKKISGKNTTNSLQVKSLLSKKNLNVVTPTDPKRTRLHSHKEYAAPRTMPKPAKKVVNKLVCTRPDKTKNSPTKLLVPGKPKLASEKNKKTTAKHGITWHRAP